MQYEFRDTRVDVKSRQIWRGSDELHLTRKAFELLILLLEQRPHVVTNEEIHARLWPDTYVTESSVQRLIFEIRQAVGDDGQRQIVLRTAHGVGYAFSAVAREIRGTSPNVRGWLIAESLRIPLREGDNVLGREGEGVTTIDASTISRRHARIEVAGEIWVEDLGSKNGTWVRDERVTERTVLADGDSVRLGSLLFTFRVSRGVDSTDTMSQSAAF